MLYPYPHAIDRTPGFELIAPAQYRGRLDVSRWSVMDLPEAYDPSTTELEAHADTFDYADPGQWYLNFAHHELFAFYGGPLFAQDEIQVAEHPALGSLREALLHTELTPLTVEDGLPTPILIRGVERCAHVDTSRIYGQQFARSSDEVIAASVRRIDPPTICNILAIEAPDGGRGRYTSMQIGYVLETAYTGFAAVEEETPGAVIHTGFWGCGAYGGNRILMPMLQIIAARMAKIAKLVFHAVSPSGVSTLQTSMTRLEELAPASTPTSKLISALTAQAFGWACPTGISIQRAMTLGEKRGDFLPSDPDPGASSRGPQLEDAYGTKLARAIASQPQTWLLLRSGEPETARFLENALGQPSSSSRRTHTVLTLAKQNGCTGPVTRLYAI